MKLLILHYYTGVKGELTLRESSVKSLPVARLGSPVAVGEEEESGGTDRHGGRLGRSNWLVVASPSKAEWTEKEKERE